MKEAIKINPQYSEAFNNIGNSYKQKLELSLAIQNYKKAIDISPTYVDALCNLGICLALEKRYEQAKNVYEKAHSLDSERIDIKIAYANIFLKLNETAIARKLFQEVIELNSNSAEALNGLGL